MKCEICEKEILRDYQYINYKYYHNDCIENLQQQYKQIKEKITDLNCYLYSRDFKSNFKSINNEVYIRAKIKDIIGLSMSEEELWNIKNKYYNIVIRPSFTTRKLKELQKENEQLKDNWNKLRKWIVYNKHNENTEQHYLVVDYGTLLGKMRELEQGSDSN